MTEIAEMTDPLTHSPAIRARQLLEAGLAASRANEPAQALAHYAQAGEAAPRWALPRFLLGSEFAAMGDYAKAEACLAHAVLLDGHLDVARYQLGLLQFSGSRPQEALLTWQPLLGTAPEAGLPDFVRGFMALAEDDATRARSCFGEGLAQPKLNPGIAADVRLLLANLPQTQCGVDTGITTAAREAENGRSAATHVLLANYGQFGLH